MSYKFLVEMKEKIIDQIFATLIHQMINLLIRRHICRYPRIIYVEHPFKKEQLQKFSNSIQSNILDIKASV